MQSWVNILGTVSVIPKCKITLSSWLEWQQVAGQIFRTSLQGAQLGLQVWGGGFGLRSAGTWMTAGSKNTYSKP